MYLNFDKIKYFIKSFLLVNKSHIIPDPRWCQLVCVHFGPPILNTKCLDKSHKVLYPWTVAGVGAGNIVQLQVVRLVPFACGPMMMIACYLMLVTCCSGQAQHNLK